MSRARLPNNYRDIYCNTCKKYGIVNRDMKNTTDSGRLICQKCGSVDTEDETLGVLGNLFKKIMDSI